MTFSISAEMAKAPRYADELLFLHDGRHQLGWFHARKPLGMLIFYRQGNSRPRFHEEVFR